MQQPEACCALSWGIWPQITGPSAVAGCTGSRKGVGSGLLLLTGPLVPGAAADLPLGSKIAAAAHACPWSLCRQCPATCECTEIEAPMAGLLLSLSTPQQWSLASLAGPGFFPDSLSCGALSPLRLSSHSQPQTSEAQSQHSATTHPSRRAEKHLRLSSAGQH